MQPCSSKQSSLSKTDNLNPVIITTALNSTLNHMVDVMERTLDATAAPSAPTPSTAPPPIINPSIESSQPSSASMSSVEILDQVTRIISGINSLLTEDQLLLASLFFTSASDDAICAAHTFIALGNNHTVQYCFLLRQLSTSSAKGKDRAVEFWLFCITIASCFVCFFVCTSCLLYVCTSYDQKNSIILSFFNDIHYLLRPEKSSSLSLVSASAM